MLGDLPACVQALADVHRVDGYPTRWPARPSEWLNPQNLLAAWVTTEGDQAAADGHVTVLAPGHERVSWPIPRLPAERLAAISRLLVHPTLRRTGRARALLAVASDYARTEGLTLVLDVVDDGRTAAIGLYEGLGWQLVGRRRADWTMPTGQRPVLRRYVEPATPGQ